MKRSLILTLQHKHMCLLHVPAEHRAGTVPVHYIIQLHAYPEWVASIAHVECSIWHSVYVARPFVFSVRVSAAVELMQTFNATTPKDAHMPIFSICCHLFVAHMAAQGY